MPLVTSTEMFKKAYDGGYAIGAFNVNNMEIVQGITEACQEEKRPCYPAGFQGRPRLRQPHLPGEAGRGRRRVLPRHRPSRCIWTTAPTSRPARPASTAASPPS